MIEGDNCLPREARKDRGDKNSIKYTFEFLNLRKSKKFVNTYERNLCKEFEKGDRDKTEEFKPNPARRPCFITPRSERPRRA